MNSTSYDCIHQQLSQLPQLNVHKRMPGFLTPAARRRLGRPAPLAARVHLGARSITLVHSWRAPARVLLGGVLKLLISMFHRKETKAYCCEYDNKKQTGDAQSHCTPSGRSTGERKFQVA